MRNAAPENDSRPGVFNLRLSMPIGLLPFLFPFRSAFGPPPVLHRWRRGLATTAPASRHRIPPAIGAGSLLGQREEGKDGGRGARYSFQTGLPPVQDRWEPERRGGKREKMGGGLCGYSYQTGLPPVQDRWGARGRRERYSGQPVTERKRVCEKTRNQARMRQIEHRTPDTFRESRDEFVCRLPNDSTGTGTPVADNKNVEASSGLAPTKFGRSMVNKPYLRGPCRRVSTRWISCPSLPRESRRSSETRPSAPSHVRPREIRLDRVPAHRALPN